MSPPRPRDELEHACGVAVREDVPLAEHTSFAIGGPAALFVRVASVDQLAAALRTARRLGLATLVLGGGTNLLVSDSGFDGLAVQLALDEVTLDPAGGIVRCGAGAGSAALVAETIAAGLGGLEFAAGLPGSVGGAVAGNAGCFGATFGERLVRATIVEGDGAVREVDDPAWFGFDYRRSTLAERGAVVAAVELAVAPADRARLEDAAAGHLALRAAKHPAWGVRTAGSYFKNLPPAEPGGRRRAAGELLDKAGAKGLAVGDAAVFERHANIVINRGRARARDVLELTARMAALVKERFDVELHPEVRFVGERPASGR